MKNVAELNVHESKQLKFVELKKMVPFVLSFVFPILIIILQPLGMNLSQSTVAAGLVLVITWWSGGMVNKIVSSCILLLIFLLCGRVPGEVVFSFPLSDSFLLIILCYLFSQGIDNAHIAEKTLSPFLFRYVNTPLKMVFASIAFLTLTMYMIPQPLARLIIIANIIRTHLRKTDAKTETQEVLLFAIFVFYVIINMLSLDADIILNTSSVAFAGLTTTSQEWLSYMALPTIIYCAIVLVLFTFVFRKQITGQKLTPIVAVEKEKFTPKEKIVFLIVCATVVLWMTSSWHGISPTYITLLGTAILFVMKILRVKDFSAIDVTTLVFLTAAFCIGGVMKHTGIAEIIFSKIRMLFPAQFGFPYLLTMILITMGMHLILGSNTTTLSVVLPGLMAICSGMLPNTQILFIAYISLTSHYLLPFHSVANSIGVGNRYFPAKYVAKFGLPMMGLIIFAIFCIYLPYWNLMKLM